MRFATLFAIGAASAQQFSMDDIAEMIALEDVAQEEQTELLQTRKVGGTWDPNGLPNFKINHTAGISTIEFCRAKEGWLQSMSFIYRDGKKLTTGSGGEHCKKIVLLPGDCITKVCTHAGGYVEEWTFDTKKGSYGHVGHAPFKVSAPVDFNFGGKCLTGVYGRNNKGGAHLVEMGFIYA